MESDEDLYRRIRKGDLAAFDVLYERHKKGLFGFIYGYLRNVEEAEEVFHEAFLQVHKSSETDFGQGSFRAWVYLVARNFCLNRLRSRRRGERAAAEIGAVEPVAAPSAESLLVERDLSDRLRSAADRLPEAQLQVLRLRISGLAYKDIARVLEIPLGTVKSRFHSIVAFIQAEIRR